MSLLRITNGFDKLNDAQLEVKANSILTCMTGNTQLPNPTPTLPVFQQAILDFSNALAKAKSGSNYDKAVKNSRRAELINQLHLLGSYVVFASAGDLLTAKSSDFNIARGPSPAPELTPAANLVLEDGPNAGELKLRFDKVPGARSYLYQYSLDPLAEDSAWQSVPGTVRKTVFTGLQSGKRYWVRVMAIGINGQAVYSEPVSRIVQ